jgi:hypothetical protein
MEVGMAKTLREDARESTKHVNHFGITSCETAVKITDEHRAEAVKCVGPSQEEQDNYMLAQVGLGCADRCPCDRAAPHFSKDRSSIIAACDPDPQAIPLGPKNAI